jgi:hypothetical protein
MLLEGAGTVDRGRISEKETGNRKGEDDGDRDDRELVRRTARGGKKGSERATQGRGRGRVEGGSARFSEVRGSGMGGKGIWGESVTLKRRQDDNAAHLDKKKSMNDEIKLDQKSPHRGGETLQGLGTEGGRWPPEEHCGQFLVKTNNVV